MWGHKVAAKSPGRQHGLWSHLLRTQSLRVPSLKSGVNQYTAIHATLTVRDIPRYFLPFWSIHLHFFQNLSRVFPVLVVAKIGSCVGPQNKVDHLAHRYRNLMQVPVLSARGI